MAKKNINRTRIIELANNMTKVLDLVPPIDITVSDENIVRQMKVAAKLILPTDMDKFSQESIDDFKELGIDLLGKVEHIEDEIIDIDKELEESSGDLDSQSVIDTLKVSEEPEEKAVEVTSVTEAVISEVNEQQISTVAIDGELLDKDDLQKLNELVSRKGRAPYFKRLVELILKERPTKKDLIEKILAEIPDVRESAVKAAILDSKNPKYSRFKPYYLVEDSEGRLYIVKPKSN